VSGRDLAHPLASFIAEAARRLPAETGATAEARARAERTVILADCSGSMEELVDRRRKADILQDALDQVLPGLPAAHVVAFASIAVDIARGGRLPPPSGGTALHLALDHASRQRPGHVLVISDGHPDDEAAAIAAVDRLRATIDVIYCGPDGDRAAIEFLRRLAARRGGSVVVHDLARASSPVLSREMRRLALPRPR
jgi:hypothetical protein